MEQDLELLLRAGIPMVWLHTPEESRSRPRVRAVAEKLDLVVFEWKCSTGFVQVGGPRLRPPGDNDCTNVDLALRAAGEYKVKQALFLIHDFDLLFSRLQPSPDAVLLARRIKDLGPDLRRTGNAIVFLVSTAIVPPELAGCFSVVSAALPTQNERVDIIRDWLVTNADGAALEDEMLFRVSNAAAGMTSSDMQTALAVSYVRHRDISPQLIEDMVNRKIEIVRSSVVLEFIRTEETLETVGGLGQLKEHLATRAIAFGPAAERYGLRPPKGVVVVGPPGVGKSLVAKSSASALGLPLIRFDFGKVHASLVGQSEERIRSALALLEVLAPCVMWLDEIEKGVAGANGPSGDSGVSQRVLGTLLTWMQEHPGTVFVFATANNISLLPPELLRKGRFDEIFFIDLPTAEERKEILRVLLRKRGRDHKGIVTDALIEKLDGFTGAEIEGVLDDALYTAFYDKQRPLTRKDIEAAITRTVPLAVQMRDEIERLRQWGRANARPASN